LGHINDPYKLALLNSAMDVVVTPSSAEAFEQVYIEAIACGTPVAGYPVAAVPEAIQEGVTGMLASDNNPASLAAAIHYLYIHPELRDDLAKWGRLYVENEWSEFSAYRHIFIALDRLGLTKSLNLRRKIEFLPIAPRVPPFQERVEKLLGLASPPRLLGDRAGR
jgi:glycosyltransferase involved in cell wall biosynthesis